MIFPVKVVLDNEIYVADLGFDGVIFVVDLAFDGVIFVVELVNKMLRMKSKSKLSNTTLGLIFRDLEIFRGPKNLIKDHARLLLQISMPKSSAV